MGASPSATGILPKPIRAMAILTNTYVDTDIIDCSDSNQLVYYIDFTKGSLDSMQVVAWFSEAADGTFFQETFNSISGANATETLGIHNYTADGKYRLAIPVKDKFCKLSLHGTGTLTSSKAEVHLTKGVV